MTQNSVACRLIFEQTTISRSCPWLAAQFGLNSDDRIGVDLMITKLRQRDRTMKKVFTVASVSWLCLFVLLSVNSLCPASPRCRIVQTRKATEPNAATQRD